MGFTLEVEDEIIIEDFSNKLERPLINPSNKFWRYLKKSRTPTSNFQIGYYPRYKNEGHNEMADLLDINEN